MQIRSGVLAIYVVEESSVDLTLKSRSLNHTDMDCCDEDHSPWRLIGIYGHPEGENEHRTWRLLKGLKENDDP